MNPDKPVFSYDEKEEVKIIDYERKKLKGPLRKQMGCRFSHNGEEVPLLELMKGFLNFILSAENILVALEIRLNKDFMGVT